MAKLAGATLLGALTAVFIIWLIASANQAYGQEPATPTYEASSGQQDRGFNYRSPPQVTWESITIYESPDMAAHGCEPINRELLALVEYIAQQIAASPRTGHYYAQSLITIREAWCNNDD